MNLPVAQKQVQNLQTIIAYYNKQAQELDSEIQMTKNVNESQEHQADNKL